MRLLKLCFVLLVFGTSAKAQEKETCFYHVSFHKWKWNYCYGKDTVMNYDKQGNLINDTIGIDTANHPQIFVLAKKDTTSFNGVHFEVTSFDGMAKYEVKSFAVFLIRKSGSSKYVECTGAYLNKAALKVFNQAESGEHIWLEHLEITDPNLHKEIVLPKIIISVE